MSEGRWIEVIISTVTCTECKVRTINICTETTFLILVQYIITMNFNETTETQLKCSLSALIQWVCEGAGKQSPI